MASHYHVARLTFTQEVPINDSPTFALRGDAIDYITNEYFAANLRDIKKAIPMAMNKICHIRYWDGTTTETYICDDNCLGVYGLASVI
jgi:hypothetical protein